MQGTPVQPFNGMHPLPYAVAPYGAWGAYGQGPHWPYPAPHAGSQSQLVCAQPPVQPSARGPLPSTVQRDARNVIASDLRKERLPSLPLEQVSYKLPTQDEYTFPNSSGQHIVIAWRQGSNLIGTEELAKFSAW